MMAASLVPRGKAAGVDVWRTNEQSGNAPSVTWRNVEREAVADRVALQTADMRQLPFAPGSFDLIVSSAAIHNIQDLEGMRQAIDEAVRVLRPGGRMVIADFNETRGYAQRLRELGMNDVKRRGLGWRFWYGGPWAAIRLVSACKPL